MARAIPVLRTAHMAESMVAIVTARACPVDLGEPSQNMPLAIAAMGGRASPTRCQS